MLLGLFKVPDPSDTEVRTEMAVHGFKVEKCGLEYKNLDGNAKWNVRIQIMSCFLISFQDQNKWILATWIRSIARLISHLKRCIYAIQQEEYVTSIW